PTLLEVFQISNLELGTCFSAYGVVAMASYFFGGPLADKYAPRNLISFALWLTSLGGVVMTVYPTVELLFILYAFWGFTTIFLLWAALIRATREWGGESQGKAFGFLEGGRGLTAAAIGTFAVILFDSAISSQMSGNYDEHRIASYQTVLIATSLITFLTGVFVWYSVPKQIVKSKEQFKPTVSSVINLMKLPTIWMQAVIIICAYVGYKITDDYSLYANEVLHFDEVSAAAVGTFALWMRPLFATVSGLVADKFDPVKVIAWCFGIMIVGGLLVYQGAISHPAWLAISVLTTTLIGVYGIRGIYFAVVQRVNVPLASTGTAVGIISFVGFTPDIFMSPLMGYVLDKDPGVIGHRNVFLILSIFAVMGLLTSMALYRKIKAEAANTHLA
ncbi:MFS transporter, partial [Fulvivirga lutimaris]|uniref:MFS transporter n=1 Tax=Fulvivirga lutimaris TaxID=1819566 RepID=UPI0012BD7220